MECTLSACRGRRRRTFYDDADDSDSEGFYDASGVALVDDTPPEDIIVPATAFYDAGASTLEDQCLDTQLAWPPVIQV